MAQFHFDTGKPYVAAAAGSQRDQHDSVSNLRGQVQIRHASNGRNRLGSQVRTTGPSVRLTGGVADFRDLVVKGDSNAMRRPSDAYGGPTRNHQQQATAQPLNSNSSKAISANLLI